MGKLSKPQRSKKHKKLKAVDPFYTGNRPVEKNVERFNKAPVIDDECELSGHDTAKVKCQANQRPGKSQWKHQLYTEQDGVPEFKRRVGESERAFMQRVDRETQAVIEQSKFDDKFHRMEPSQADIDSKLQLPMSTRRDKRKLRLQLKKGKSFDRKRQKREDRSGGFARLRDNVKFGEVVLEPPTLSAKPRQSTSTPADQSEERRRKHESLLLSRLFTATPGKNSDVMPRPQRRRSHSMAERVVLDAERQRAITLYRQLKTTSQLQ